MRNYFILVSACLLIFKTQAQNTFPATGRVGIGTTTPSAWLTLKPTDANAIEVRPFGTASGNTSELRFLELAASGTNYTGFRSPSALGSNLMLVLPSTAGTSGQALSTNGSGVLSWASFANTALSNLAATTAINSDLRPSGLRSLGSSASQWSNLFLSGNVYRGAANSLQWNTTTGNVELAGAISTSGSFSLDNISIGPNAGASGGNTGHANDISIGTNAGHALTTGSNNILIGQGTGYILSSGGGNTIVGSQAATSVSTGSDNTLLGAFVGASMNDGNSNVFVGRSAGNNIQNGSSNVCIGNFSGGSLISYPASGVTLLGYQAQTSGSWDNAAAIGNGAIVTASDRIRLGNNSITRISGQVGFFIDSDKRLKQHIEPYHLGLNFIKELQPVSYEYINNVEGGNRQGFIAQDVEKALKGANFEGLSKPANEQDYYAVNYAAFVVPLVNAVKELSARVEKLEAENAQLKTENKPNFESTNRNENASFQLVPNPANEQSTLKLPNNENGMSLMIYNSERKLVRIENIPAGINSYTISTRDFINGIYSIILMSGDRVYCSKQLVVSK